MAENIKNEEDVTKVEENDLEKVDGGIASSFIKLKSELADMIPANVWEELKTIKNDDEFRKKLEERGIDVEKLERKARTAKLTLGSDGQQNNNILI